MQLLEYPINQVEHIPGLGKWNPQFNRWKGATDEEIVRWCGANDHIWVTQDEDSRSRALRMGLPSTKGVAVIFVSPQPKGLQAQTELVVRQYPRWQERLGAEPAGYSAWLQRPYGALKRQSK
jgi:Domain of unknown function (DUF5615)